MNNSNKQAEIRVFDTNYNKIGSTYRPMMYNDLLNPKRFDTLVNKILNSIKSKSINTMNRLELPEHTTENSALLGNMEICSKLLSSVTSINTMNRLELPEHTTENSALLSNMELRFYALSALGRLDNEYVRIQTARKSTPEDAISELVEIAKKTRADAIVVDADKPFQNEDGYGLVALLYVKR